MSAKACGIYLAMRAAGRPLTADDLSGIFSEGRSAMLSGLKELADAGLIQRTKQVVNGRCITVTTVVEGAEIEGSIIALQLLQYQQKSIKAISPLYKEAFSFLLEQKRLPGEPGKGEKEFMYKNSGDGALDADYLAERKELQRRELERRGQEYRDARDSRVRSRIEDLRNAPPSEWSTDQSAYYFASRMSKMWRVEPWTGARTRFKGALATARKNHGTDGAVEQMMMDRFFESIEHNKSMNNPEIIWKLFIRNFQQLLLDVEQSMVTVEQAQQEREKARREKEWF